MHARLAILVPTLMVLAGSGLHAQEFERLIPQHSTVPAEARYEIVQSPRAARYTFLVDKERGLVSRLVIAGDSVVSWAPIPRMSHPAGSPEHAGRVNYELYTSGVAAIYTFLVNVNSGATWRLTADSAGGMMWLPVGRGR
jgi:hypothetical protein